MTWSNTDTMTLMSFAADAGVGTLSGTPRLDSLAQKELLINEQFPLVKTYSGLDFELKWGPYLLSKFDIQKLRFNVVNAMNVSQQKGTNNYVIGIAGTDARSAYDWIVEDFEIRPVPWPYAKAGNVEKGAMVGLKNLQAMKPFRGTAQPGVALIDYLAKLTSKKINITVTGHSLGGALCEVVAMWLADTQGVKGGWDPNRNATIIPISFAGPTPGETTWANHFNSTFQNNGSLRVWNSLDVVPHAWNATQMKEIAGLYGKTSPPTTKEKIALDIAVFEANKHDYVQVLGDGTEMTGTLQKGLSFAQQAGYQHICAYYNFIGVPPPAICASFTKSKPKSKA